MFKVELKWQWAERGNTHKKSVQVLPPGQAMGGSEKRPPGTLQRRLAASAWELWAAKHVPSPTVNATTAYYRFIIITSPSSVYEYS